MTEINSGKLEKQALDFLKIAADDIRFAKNQQWNTANYVLLIYGAFFGVTKSAVEICKEKICDEIMLLLFFLALFCVATWIIGICRVCDLEKWRKSIGQSMSDAEKHLSPDYRCWSKYRQNDNSPNGCDEERYRHILIITLAMTIGFLITIGVIVLAVSEFF